MTESAIDPHAMPLHPVRAVADFTRFYETEYRAVVGLARVLSGSSWAAEDLAQEGFLAARRRWDEVGRYDRPGAFVRRVVANKAVSRHRRLTAEARALTRLAPLRRRLEPLDPPDDAVWRAVRRLPNRQAQVVALTYLEDLLPGEVAEVLDISVDTVRTHLRRAHHTLSTVLPPDPEVHP